MSSEERNISGARLELMRSALDAYATDGEPRDGVRARARDAVLAGDPDLARLAQLFNDAAQEVAPGDV